MKTERVQFRASLLDGWVLLMQAVQGLIGKEEPVAIWTAYDLADHLEACELVPQIGQVADKACVAPEIDVRGNVVFVTAKTDGGLTEADFDFAEALDRSAAQLSDGAHDEDLAAGLESLAEALEEEGQDEGERDTITETRRSALSETLSEIAARLR